MNMVRIESIAVRRYPIDIAVDALRSDLLKLTYNPRIISEILPFAHDEGSLIGAIELGMIDPEDVETLTEAFVDGFGIVHESDPSWCDASTWVATEHPTAEESRILAELIGDFDSDDAPLPDDQPDEDWLEFARQWAISDPSDPIPFEEAELSEARILIRHPA